MRIEYLAGDRAGAIRRYEQLRRLLDDDLGVPPLDETRALHDAIITDTLPASSLQPAAHSQAPAGNADQRLLTADWRLPTGSLPLIGRDAELAQLGSLASSHRLGLIEGEPGIGKTRLATAFIERSAGVALVGGARELEQALPYQPVIEALRGLLRQIGRPALFAELGLSSVWLRELTRLLPELHADGELAVVDTIVPGGNESRLWRR